MLSMYCLSMLRPSCLSMLSSIHLRSMFVMLCLFFVSFVALSTLMSGLFGKLCISPPIVKLFSCVKQVVIFVLDGYMYMLVGLVFSDMGVNCKVHTV